MQLIENLQDNQVASVQSIMERAEALLGARREWIAVKHHDTDNPHTHIEHGRHQRIGPLTDTRRVAGLNIPLHP